MNIYIYICCETWFQTIKSNSHCTVSRRGGGQHSANRCGPVCPGINVPSFTNVTLSYIFAVSAGGKDKSVMCRVLLVISHPDDESMFFVPVISELVRSGVELFVLCLSTGDADGQGMTRQLEMDEVAEHLGIDIDNVTIVDDPGLQDGMQNAWSSTLIAKLVQEMVMSCDISKVN